MKSTAKIEKGYYEYMDKYNKMPDLLVIGQNRYNAMLIEATREQLNNDRFLGVPVKVAGCKSCYSFK